MHFLTRGSGTPSAAGQHTDSDVLRFLVVREE